MAINQETITYPRTHSLPTAAAGSTSQLPRLEIEMASSSTKPTSTDISTDNPATSSTSSDPSYVPHVLQCPFQVVVKKLTKAEIEHYTSHKISTTDAPPSAKPCTVYLGKLFPRDIQDYNTVQAKLRDRGN